MPVKPLPKILLNMIVKDEEARIERCLASVLDVVSAYCIIDTGSTDRTEVLAKQMLHNLPGLYRHEPFENFGLTRTRALRHAQHIDALDAFKGMRFDFILLVDADMELVASGTGWPLRLEHGVSYDMEQRSSSLTYWNTRLIPWDVKQSHYVGVTHEYLDVSGPRKTLEGPYFIDHADGANRPGKLKRDIALLKRDIESASRSLYYLAQSYRDDGDDAAAIPLFAARAMLGGYAEEAWCAKLNEGRARMRTGDHLGGVGALLGAHAMRSDRNEALADLTRHYRDAGRHAVVMALGIMSSAAPPPGDKLFVEHDCYGPYGRIAEDMSVSGFYVEAYRDAGFALCDTLATRANVPECRRDQARRNLAHYAPTLSQLLGGEGRPMPLKLTQLAPPAEEGWHPCNPSVIARHGRLDVVVRTVNYTQERGRYTMQGGVIETRNWFCMIDPEGQPDNWTEIADTLSNPPKFAEVRGLEDMRLFGVRAGLGFVACCRERNVAGVCQQVSGRITGDLAGMLSAEVWLELSDPVLGRHEKNWTPVLLPDGDLDCYLYDFTGELRRKDAVRSRVAADRPSRFALDHLRGSGQAIPWRGGYLTVAHEVVEGPGGRRYLHRFVRLTEDLDVRSVSRPFTLTGAAVEFVAGLARHPRRDVFVLSFGVEDREAYLVEIPATALEDMLP